MITTSYTVLDMTCGHCASSVSAEVKAIPGVTDVEVDVASGVVSVTASSPIPESQMRAAVEEAGYELAAAS